MSRQRDASRIPGGTVRATVLSVLRCAVPLLTVALWLAPSFLHPAVEHAPAAGHVTVSAHCPPHPARAAPTGAALAALARSGPEAMPVVYPILTPWADSAGGAGDNCVAGPGGVSQGLVPAPVPPPAPAQFLPRDRPHDTHAARAPPDHAVPAPGLHQLQVLRT
ncbi:hypothetical protein B7755_024795 [Streptomyces sp. NBS 14/10]|uniref:hypothetical protein n=1 Tax=Streptomyces sp. NBS 14/10 TaxID=1945643 RepID=UPI001180B330|nr:hypothetical protein [Streptomyces sp. NBS 14/10]KAK1181073.1 hypothetical protein B7755_024795 [Streptomyces sp. NBS 14/10]